MTLEEQILTGMTESHLADYNGARVHKEALNSLSDLSNELAKNGFILGVVSSFRGFESQLKIWNAKATGRRTLLDSNSKPLDYFKLSKTEIIHAILKWSALPGLSRHHWGTDFDVIDTNSTPKDYKVQLVTSEFVGQGYYAKMHLWLDKNMSRFGFFRPYQKEQGGVSPERWHISYHPIASQLKDAHSVELETETLKNSAIELKSEVLKELPSIFTRYFLNVSTT